MKFNVTFRSTFPVNFDTQNIGKELAEFLAQKLRESGLEITRVDNHDDFAWGIETGQRGNGPFILLGYLEDGDMEWLASIETSVGFFGRLLGKSDLKEREELAKGLDKVLRGDQRFQKIRWHEGEQGMSPSSEFPDHD